MPLLTTASQSNLSGALAGLRGAGPVALVVATDPYARLLDNWIAHADALGIDYLIVALDDALDERLSRAGIAGARCDWDGTYPDFVLQRALTWDFLARNGIDFIQTDMDAVWLKNPIPEFFARSTFDVLGSQGTFHPVAILERWGFVLCSGFFHARSTAATKALFAAMLDQSDRIVETDCQYVLNFLLDERGIVWDDTGRRAERATFRGYDFTCYDDVLPGRCEALGLRVGMLPHRLFQRHTDGDPAAFVKHVQRTKDPTRRIEAMRAAGCWMLDRVSGRLAAPCGPFE